MDGARAIKLSYYVNTILLLLVFGLWGFEDVDGRDFKQINLLDDGFSLVGILRKEIVIEIFLNGIRHQVVELEAVTDSSWTSKEVVVLSLNGGLENDGVLQVGRLDIAC